MLCPGACGDMIQMQTDLRFDSMVVRLFVTATAGEKDGDSSGNGEPPSTPRPTAALVTPWCLPKPGAKIA